MKYKWNQQITVVVSSIIPPDTVYIIDRNRIRRDEEGLIIVFHENQHEAAEEVRELVKRGDDVLRFLARMDNLTRHYKGVEGHEG